jgi:hypothetical protein
MKEKRFFYLELVDLLLDSLRNASVRCRFFTLPTEKRPDIRFLRDFLESGADPNSFLRLERRKRRDTRLGGCSI